MAGGISTQNAVTTTAPDRAIGSNDPTARQIMGSNDRGSHNISNSSHSRRTSSSSSSSNQSGWTLHHQPPNPPSISRNQLQQQEQMMHTPVATHRTSTTTDSIHTSISATGGYSSIGSPVAAAGTSPVNQLLHPPPTFHTPVKPPFSLALTTTIRTAIIAATTTAMTIFATLMSSITSIISALIPAFLLRLLLTIIQFSYLVFSWLELSWKELRQCRSRGLRSSLHRGYVACILMIGRYSSFGRRISSRLLRPQCRLQTEHFSRLPQHLAIAFDHLPTITTPTPTPTTTHELTSTKVEVKQIAELILTCWQLPIPEITLFDQTGDLSRDWEFVASGLATLMSQSGSDSSINSSTIWVIQGDSPLIDHINEDGSHHDGDVDDEDDDRMDMSRIGIIYHGRLEFVDLESLMGSSSRDSRPVSNEADRFGSLEGEPDWRQQIYQHVIKQMPRSRTSGNMTPTISRRSSTVDGFTLTHDSTPNRASPSSIRLLTILGPRHSQQVLADAAIHLACGSTNPYQSSTPHYLPILSHPSQRLSPSLPTTVTKYPLLPSSFTSPTSSSPPPPHLLRQYLQRELMTLPLTEPDLLLVISPHATTHRSLVGFPPWLIRLVEIMYAVDVDSLVYGYSWIDRLHDFGRTIQRGGT